MDEKSKEFKSAIKTSQQRLPMTWWLPWWIIPYIYRERERERRINFNSFQTQSKSSGVHTSRLVLQGLKTKPDKETTRKEKYRPISLISIDKKTLNKIVANQTHRQFNYIILPTDEEKAFDKIQHLFHDNSQNIWCRGNIPQHSQNS